MDNASLAGRGIANGLYQTKQNRPHSLGAVLQENYLIASFKVLEARNFGTFIALI